MVLWFSVLLNVNLALLNLLPFPVLDGGHITLALWSKRSAAARSARKSSSTSRALAPLLLIGFMLFIAFYDTGDWVRSARSDREEPMVFAPKASKRINLSGPCATVALSPAFSYRGGKPGK